MRWPNRRPLHLAHHRHLPIEAGRSAYARAGPGYPFGHTGYSACCRRDAHRATCHGAGAGADG